MDSIAGAPPHTATPPSSRPSPFPGREDCWSEEATFTLIEAWGERHLELNRGNLRQRHWQEVADTVNARHGNAGARARRTDVQCKNRIDTLKKKYKIEKARVSDSGDSATAWPFFRRLEFLIGDNFPAKKPSPPESGSADRRSTPPAKSPAWALIPVGPRSRSQKRPTPAAPAAESVADSYFRRNFSVFAAAAAAAAEADSDNSNGSKWSSGSEKREKKKRGRDWEFGYREVAEALERFGEIYERVEEAKQRQMVELEKQRMQFAKDLETQRMKLFMETQLHLQKMNRSNSKRSSATDSVS
ncbi:trihelix transcription factor ASIL1 [Vigna umbellata]|uniref:Trihelix transcription factor n=1 Tax=Phaseolus angularis TaxID=3914 RepID=A0A8T0JGB7_PHAAN|nr:trihelix transcription factor ENAP2 [Vigna angularis]XP_047167831.1 trihelix transcription factor ASIL1 [Vigna umbellata]KAG2371787.1 Trihelix transcription factor [Vigna angularis]